MSPKKECFTERINVFFTPEQLERIKEKADKYGLTVSAYIRMVIVSEWTDRKLEQDNIVSWLAKFNRHIRMGDRYPSDEENFEFYKKEMAQQFGWDTKDFTL